MAHASETEIERAARRVREDEEHLLRQREIVDRLGPEGELAAVAWELLASYEQILVGDREHLARLRAGG